MHLNNFLYVCMYYVYIENTNVYLLLHYVDAARQKALILWHFEKNLLKV